jgi:hypothetical protein
MWLLPGGRGPSADNNLWPPPGRRGLGNFPALGLYSPAFIIQPLVSIIQPLFSII